MIFTFFKPGRGVLDPMPEEFGHFVTFGDFWTRNPPLNDNTGASQVFQLGDPPAPPAVAAAQRTRVHFSRPG